MRHRFARRRQFDIAGQSETVREVKFERVTQSRRRPKPRMIGSSLAVAAALLSAVAPLAAESEPSPAATIVVEGNRRVEADTVRSYFHPGPDGRLDEAARDE